MKYDFLINLRSTVIKSYELFTKLLPINKKRIILYQLFKYGYDCNQKYIAEELIKRNKGYEIIWITREHMIDNASFPPQIKVIPTNSIFRKRYYYYTSGFLITNVYNPHFLKRKEQMFINTWHGSLGIKKLEQTYGNTKVEEMVKDTDAFISNSQFESNVYRESLHYKDKIYLYGHPRNDVFFEDSPYYPDKNLIKKQLEKYTNTNLDNKKVVLYAPTFRDDLSLECFDMDYNLLLETLQEKYKQEFVLFIRLHPRISALLNKKVTTSKQIFDLTKYNDMQGLMVYSDIIITDYSSCIFDFMLSRKPGFIYASDIEKYNHDRGFYYPLETTPFPIIKNNNELREKILSFDYDSYKIKLEEFLKEKGCIEDGHASERVVDLIEQNIH